MHLEQLPNISCWPADWQKSWRSTSPLLPMIDLDLSACFSIGDPILVAEDLISKHYDWNSRLITRASLLCDYASENSCSIYISDTLTTHCSVELCHHPMS